MAKKEIFYSLMLSVDTTARAAADSGVYDFHSSAAEMGLALIASKNGDFANHSLLGLLQYRMDGELSEDFECYALQKGKKLRPAIKALDAGKLAEMCQSDVRRAVEQSNHALDLGKVILVCAEREKIEGKVSELALAIKESKKCSSEDF